MGLSKLLGAVHRMLARDQKHFTHIDAPGNVSPGLYSYVTLNRRNDKNPFGGVMPPPVKQHFEIRGRFIYPLDEYNQYQNQSGLLVNIANHVARGSA